MIPILDNMMKSTISDAIGNVVNRLVPDKNAAERARLDMEKSVFDAIVIGNQSQAEINKAEAQNPNVFVSGWRPFIGWVCGLGLLYQFLLSPILPWVINASGGNVPPMPGLDGTLGELVVAMLGLGLLRSGDKYLSSINR